MRPTEAIELLDSGHQRVRRLLERLEPAEWERPATIGGGDWSARDLTSHLTSWERHAIEALEAWRDGRAAAVDRALRTRGVAGVNAATLEVERHRPATAVRRDFDDVHARLVAMVAAIPDDAWDAPPTGRKRRSTGVLLGAILGGPGGPFRHAEAHLPDLAGYVAEIDRRGHEAAERDGERPRGGRGRRRAGGVPGVSSRPTSGEEDHEEPGDRDPHRGRAAR